MSRWQSALRRQQQIEATTYIPGSNLTAGQITYKVEYEYNYNIMKKTSISVTLKDDNSTLNGMNKKYIGLKYLFFDFGRNYETLLTPFLRS